MQTPTEMVERALRNGHQDNNAAGIVYLKQKEGYTIRPATYARLKTNILKRLPNLGESTMFGDKPPEEPKKVNDSCTKFLNMIDPDVDLALAINKLLEQYKAEHILRMLTIVACVRMNTKKD